MGKIGKIVLRMMLALVVGVVGVVAVAPAQEADAGYTVMKKVIICKSYQWGSGWPTDCTEVRYERDYGRAWSRQIDIKTVELWGTRSTWFQDLKVYGFNGMDYVTWGAREFRRYNVYTPRQAPGQRVHACFKPRDQWHSTANTPPRQCLIARLR